MISPESLRTEYEYSAPLSTGAEEHNIDGNDDLTNLGRLWGSRNSSLGYCAALPKSEIISFRSHTTRSYRENHKWMAISNKSARNPF